MKIATLIFRSTLAVFHVSISFVALSQELNDSTRRKSIIIDFEAGDYYLSPVSNRYHSYDVNVPKIISGLRKASYPAYDPTKELDNPLMHSALYLKLKTAIQVTDSTVILANLIGEHRGFSYGVYPAENMIFFPQVTMHFDKSFSILKNRVHLFFKIGNFNNARVHEGLMMYNIDVTGNDFNIAVNKFRFRFYQINDLCNGIGLNIDESYDLILSREQMRISSKWTNDTRIGYYFGSVDGPQYKGYTFSTGFYWRRVLHLYAQTAYSTRTSDRGLSNTKNYAFLIGGSQKITDNKLKMKNVIELRYYGGLFNDGFKSTRPTYRKSHDPNSYGETIGNTIYPIYGYNRPFSQWAVFTEYQTSDRKNVGALTLRSDVTYNFAGDFVVNLSLDVNHIVLQKSTPFTYPFFTGGIGWEPRKGNLAMITLTNKGMNLDISYPTFYLYRHLRWGFIFTRELDW